MTHSRKDVKHKKDFTVTKGIVQIATCTIIVVGVVHIADRFRHDRIIECHEKALDLMEAEMDVRDEINNRRQLLGQLRSAIYFTIDKAGINAQKATIDRDHDILIPLSTGDATEEELKRVVTIVKTRYPDINWDLFDDILDQISIVDDRIAEAKNKFNDISYEYYMK